MAVNIGFSSGGVALNEIDALDFGTVQAGTKSAIKTVAVTNTGDSDALNCLVEAKAASVVNGFGSDLQVGTPQDTYSAQFFGPEAGSVIYAYAVLGVGKNYTNKTGGTLSNTNGQDTYCTDWEPPGAGISGQKTWGNIFSCVYV